MPTRRTRKRPEAAETAEPAAAAQEPALPEPPPKVLVFIDEPSLTNMQRLLRTSFDHKKLRELLVAGRSLVDIRCYFRNSASPSANAFYAYLRSQGFTVLTSQEDVDPMVADDIRKMYDKADAIILIGGDHYYLEALEEARSAGKQIEVFCTDEMLAAAIKELATQITSPVDVSDQIIDPVRTKKFLKKLEDDERKSEQPPKPAAALVGQLIALGHSIKVETLPDEIVIRIKIK